ncbi:MAG TPA: hypothetical protein VKB78_04880 [Pirellulales bacterium]|nr:hypothetical protein [Pirellulales bacterium]
MIRRVLTSAILAIAITSHWCSAAPPPPSSHDDSPSFGGLWFGSWGGGVQQGGVVFQPVMAELFIKGDHIELAGFPDAAKFEGTLHIDRDAHRIRIIPAAEQANKTALKPIEYSFAIDGDKLTVILADKRAIALERIRTSQKPVANVEVELVAADEITSSGDLIVSEFTKLRVGRIGATYYEPSSRTLKTKNAAILLVEESDCKKINVADARSRFKRSTPVAIAFRPENRPNPNPLHQLWTEVGPAAADDEAARQTLAKTLRPGTLVFVFDASEKVPVP